METPLQPTTSVDSPFSSSRRRASQGANQRLREGLHEARQQLEAVHAQLAALQGLQQRLEEGTPGAEELAAAAVEQERAAQAARDAHVLHLLRSKVGREHHTTPHYTTPHHIIPAAAAGCSVCGSLAAAEQAGWRRGSLPLVRGWPGPVLACTCLPPAARLPRVCRMR